MKVKNPELKKDDKLQKTAKSNKAKDDKPKPKNKNPKIIKETSSEGTEIINSPIKNNASDNKDDGAKKKNKKSKVVENSETDISAENKTLDDKEIARIEKKKAKKIAKKLKKKQKKEEEKSQKQVQEVSSGAKTTANSNVSKKSELNKTNASIEKKERLPSVDAATVFVGNLPVTTKRVQLVKLFLKYGGVKGIRLRTGAGQIIFKHKQRKQAGRLNAYVILQDADAARKALELNGTEFKGNHLRVTPSSSATTQNEYDAKRTIFVGNLKHSANEEKLREIFSSCGDIDYIRCLGDGTNSCKGVAYVCFKSAEGVGLAMELNETLLDERPIHVERYNLKKLGAKEARDKEAAASKKNRKADNSKKTKNAQKPTKTGKEDGEDNLKEKKKKSDFRGVKVTGLKKKQKEFKKKGNKELKNLAKKIAPKTNKQKKT